MRWSRSGEGIERLRNPKEEEAALRKILEKNKPKPKPPSTEDKSK